MDDRQQITAYHLYYEEEKQRRLNRLLDMAEAVRMGTASTQTKQNYNIYFKWINKIKRMLYPKKEKKPNLWDTVRKNRKGSFIIN